MTYRVLDDLGPAGFGWLIEERYARTSHALVDDGRVWLVDPVEVPGLEERVRALGEPAGVVQLLDRHNRDCAALAERLATQLHVVPDRIDGSPFELVPVVRWRRWREVALWWPNARARDRRRAGHERLLRRTGTGGRAPLLRLVKPPRVLGRYEPAHVLVGHGEGVHGPEEAEALRQALGTARTGLPRWAADVAKAIARGAVRWLLRIVLTLKTAPCGSPSTAVLAIGESAAGTTTRPPCSSAVETAASVSATQKSTCHSAGAPSGAGAIPATTSRDTGCVGSPPKYPGTRNIVDRPNVRVPREDRVEGPGGVGVRRVQLAPAPRARLVDDLRTPVLTLLPRTQDGAESGRRRRPSCRRPGCRRARQGRCRRPA